jgi:hypothetical protein
MTERPPDVTDGLCPTGCGQPNIEQVREVHNVREIKLMTLDRYSNDNCGLALRFLQSVFIN